MITKEEIMKLFKDGLSCAEISKATGLSKSTISWRLKKYNNGNLIVPQFGKRYDWNEIRLFYEKGKSIEECISKYGFNRSSWYEAIKKGYIIPRETTKFESFATENSKKPRCSIKRMILKNNLLPEKCFICDIPPIWNGKKLVLVLDHINGVNNDHRLENLRFLCPNCNSQTETFAGKNVKRNKNK